MRSSWPSILLAKSGAIARTSCGLLLVVFALCSPALAAAHCPEIDPGAVSGAVVLLVSGTLILTDRIRRR